MKIFIIMALFSLFHLYGHCQNADNGNETFSNPVLWADFPDPDVVQVDSVYYMVSTSMHYFPGVTILASNDLVNWHIASNAVSELKYHPFYDMNGGNRYAKGQWASSIRYYRDNFYVLFNTLDEGAFMCTASSAYGPWTLHKMDAFFYDPGLFIDDDERVYIIHGNTTIYLTELNKDGLSAKSNSIVIYNAPRRGLEGNHCYHIGGFYYILCTYGGPQGKQICLRSKTINGPYEEKEILNDDANLSDMYLHQGCLIKVSDGTYWSLIFQDRVGLGRIPFLLPVNWIENWPILGRNEGGNITFKKPELRKNIQANSFPTSDDFSSSKLGLQWQFNHNPDTSKYSLIQREGFLRLYTATVTDSLMKARNTICQRIFGPLSIGTMEMDSRWMKVGDRAGLAIMQDPYATLSVESKSTGKYLIMSIKEDRIASIPMESDRVYLRGEVNAVSDLATFYYSYDNEFFRPIGSEFKMEFNTTYFCGNRYGLFCYSTKEIGGYVDINSFKITGNTYRTNNYDAYEKIEAEQFDEISGADTKYARQLGDRGNQEVVVDRQGHFSFCSVDFGRQMAKWIVLQISTDKDGEGVILHSKGDDGEIIEEFSLPNTNGQLRKVYYPLISELKGNRKISLISKKINKGTVSFDWIVFQ